MSYDAENWWVVWQPAVDLAPGDTFHVTLAKDAAEDPAGHDLTTPVSFTFRTAR